MEGSIGIASRVFALQAHLLCCVLRHDPILALAPIPAQPIIYPSHRPKIYTSARKPRWDHPRQTKDKRTQNRNEKIINNKVAGDGKTLKNYRVSQSEKKVLEDVRVIAKSTVRGNGQALRRHFVVSKAVGHRILNEGRRSKVARSQQSKLQSVYPCTVLCPGGDLALHILGGSAHGDLECVANSGAE